MRDEQNDKRRKVPIIGGPGTSLPFVLESFLAWPLAALCLGVAGYHYVKATIIAPRLTGLWSRLHHKWCAKIASSHCMYVEKPNELPLWLPLTTHSRSEMDRASPTQRLEQLVAFLKYTTKKTSWSDEKLVAAIRSNETCRRLSSLAMRPTDGASLQHHSLAQQLVRVWPALLMLPPLGEGHEYEISMIVPAYHELGPDVRTKLKRALHACAHPAKVQVVLVDAGSCVDLHESMQGMKDDWGDFTIVVFTEGGGRGPCLNFGARFATGRLYSFCHSDTVLPKDWDLKISSALCGSQNDYNKTRANSCAFSFGIDTTEAGLNGSPCPPGIKAVETKVNLRSRLFSLPYGDQVLSLPASVFNYVGGYPDQCLMEDYELVSLLRKRASLLPRFGIRDRERLVIIGEPAALCSPRRWQKFGVLYVTFMNTKFVNIYEHKGGLSPDDLFRLYYGQPPPKRSSDESPWENDMTKTLNNEC